MTEREWSDSVDPDWLITRLSNIATKRKLRLFCCACCRRIWDLLVDRECKTAIEAAEQFADGMKGRKDLLAVRAAIDQFGLRPKCNNEAVQAVRSASRYSAQKPTSEASMTAGNCAELACNARRIQETQEAAIVHVYIDDQARTNRQKKLARIEKKAQAGLLRDIFGNPFRPVTLDPRWLTSTVIDLARTIYDEFPQQTGGNEKMPILADALMDAGCDSEEVINHCQGPGPDVLGCWVVDLLTGRE